MSNSKRSDVWNHFTETDVSSKVKCNYCSQLIALSKNSTGNLFRHLKKHPISTKRAPIEVLPDEPTNKRHKPILQQDSSNPTPILPDRTNITNQEPLTSGQAPQPQERGTLASYLLKPLPSKKSKEIDKQLVAMITKECHPFSIVEDTEFKKLVNLLNPSYRLPTRKTLTQSLITGQYNLVREVVMGRLERAFAVCITVDGWTSRNNDTFYAMTAHYLVEEAKEIKLSSDLLGCVPSTERSTADNVCKKIKKMLSEWNIEHKTTVIVSDNAANMVASVKLGGWRHWGCFAHCLNLVVQTGLKEIDHVTKKIKSIVSFFRRSSYASGQLKNTQETMKLPVLKLKNDVPTRWNSTFLMLQRIVEAKVAVVATLAIIGERFHAPSDGEDVIPMTNHDWQIAEESLNVLEIFDIITNVMSAEKKVTASAVILFYKQISRHLATIVDSISILPETKKMAETLLNLSRKRFEGVEDNELIAQCTILDPRFKKYGFLSESKYQKQLQTIYHKIANIKISNENIQHQIATEVEQHDPQQVQCPALQRRETLLWKEFDEEVKKHQNPVNALASAIVEVDKYIDEPLQPRQQDPLIWWHQRKQVYPRLFQLVKTRLCIMATSVPCERIFSKAGQIVSERRTRLDTKKIEELVFLAYNLNNYD